MVNYYEILGVTRKASSDEIRQAYRRLIKEWHPDKLGAASDAQRQEAKQKTQQILLAWYHLSDPGRRSTHDHLLSNGKSNWSKASSSPTEVEVIFRRLVKEKSRAGIPHNQAVQMVLDEVTSLSNALLMVLSYPPNAITQYVLTDKLREHRVFYSSDEMTLALTALTGAGKLYISNGNFGVSWFAKLQDPIDFSTWTRDDFDWLYGTGRFAQ